VATDTGIGEESNGSRLVTAEGGHCDGERMVRCLGWKEWHGVTAAMAGGCWSRAALSSRSRERRREEEDEQCTHKVFG
jgi:hypothetical protein